MSKHWFCYGCLLYYKSEAERLQIALEEYGDHTEACYENGGRCACGYFREVVGDGD